MTKRRLIILGLLVSLLLFGLFASPVSRGDDSSGWWNFSEEPVNQFISSEDQNSSPITIPMAYVDTRIYQNNNTEMFEYDLMVNNVNYQAYFKNQSDYGEVFRYIDTQYPDMWYIEDLEEWIYVDVEGIDDYLGYNLGVEGVANNNTFTYPSVLSDGSMSVNMIYNASSIEVFNEYHLDSVPRTPGSWLGEDIQLAFGFMFDVPAGVQIMTGHDVVWDETEFVTNKTLWFLDESEDPLDIDWQLRSSFKLLAPYAVDSVGNTVAGTYKIQMKGNSFWIYKMIPYKWLANATYPVMIDPTVVDTSTQANPFLVKRPAFSGPNHHTFSYQDGAGLKTAYWTIGNPDGFTVSTVIADSTIREHSMTGYPNNDTIYVSYQRDGADDIFFKKSTDSGATYGSEVTVEVGGGTQLHYPNIELALSGTDAGRIMVGYRDAAYDSVIRYTDNEGSSWTEVTVCDDAVWGDSDPGDLIWLDDQTWVFGVREWTAPQRILIFQTTDGGDTWSNTYTGSGSTWYGLAGMSPFSTETNFSAAVTFYASENTGDTDDLFIYESIDSGASFSLVSRYDDGYPSLHYVSTTCIADGDSDGFHLFAGDDDGAGLVDDIQQETRNGATWDNPLTWSELLQGRDMYPVSRLITPKVSNLDGKAFIGWSETAASPYNVVVNELILSSWYVDPVNDATPTLDNPTSTEYMMAHYTEYEITAYVSDSNGYADIAYLEVGIWNDAHDTEYWRFRYDEDSDTFSEVADGGTYVELDTGDSSATKSGDDIDATFQFTIDWDCPEFDNLDFTSYVIDANGGDATDSYESVYETVTDANIDPLTLTDGSGTADRGDYDSIDTVTIGGTIKYFGHVVLVPDGEVDVWISCADVAGSPWSDLAPASSVFSMTVDSDDVVGLDTYTIIVVADGEGDGGTDVCHATHTDTYIADRMNFTASTSLEWVLLDETITVGVYGHYVYDGAAIPSQVWSTAGNGSVSFASAGNRTWAITSHGDTHGLTKLINTSAFCAWDTIEISSVAYYWVQYSPNQVWLIWNPSSFSWAVNGSTVQAGVRIQSQVNGTNDDYAIMVSGGTCGDFAISPPFDTSWYYANITFYALTGAYNWSIWTALLLVDILHSIKIEVQQFYLTDNWVIINIQTNWNNATFFVWDNITGTPVLVGASYEGSYPFARSSTVGVHRLIVLVNGTHGNLVSTSQVAGTVDTSQWEYLEFPYTINPVTFSITSLIMMQNNESIVVQGFWHTPNTTLTWIAYEAGVQIDSGVLTLTASGEYNAIYWEKNEPTTFNNFTLAITADGSTINLHSYSYVLDSATYLTTVSGSSLTINEGDNYFDESISGIQAEDMVVVVMELAVLVFLTVILAAIITWRDGRNKRREDYLANIASGGYQ